MKITKIISASILLSTLGSLGIGEHFKNTQVTNTHLYFHDLEVNHHAKIINVPIPLHDTEIINVPVPLHDTEIINVPVPLHDTEII